MVIKSGGKHSSWISACEKGKQPESVLEVLQVMQQQGLMPDAILG